MPNFYLTLLPTELGNQLIIYFSKQLDITHSTTRIRTTVAIKNI